jgi:hypothetical protein
MLLYIGRSRGYSIRVQNGGFFRQLRDNRASSFSSSTGRWAATLELLHTACEADDLHDLSQEVVIFDLSLSSEMEDDGMVRMTHKLEEIFAELR